LLLRAIVSERKEKVPAVVKKRPELPKPSTDLTNGMLVAVRDVGKSLKLGMEDCHRNQLPLYVLFIREQKVITEADEQRSWTDDKKACDVYDYIIDQKSQIPMGFFYTVTEHSAYTIAELAKEKKVTRIIIDRHREANPLFNVFRGTTAQEITRYIPEDIDLIVLY
jgi:hypothetical protein